MKIQSDRPVSSVGSCNKLQPISSYLLLVLPKAPLTSVRFPRQSGGDSFAWKANLFLYRQGPFACQDWQMLFRSSDSFRPSAQEHDETFPLQISRGFEVAASSCLAVRFKVAILLGRDRPCH